MATKISEDLALRALELDDYNKGYLELLSQLTTVGEVSFEQFQERHLKIQATGAYRIAVIEDVTKGKIIGSATVVVEDKFVHSCGKVGHIEDVVVDGTYRGQRLGQRLISDLEAFAVSAGCYKVILDCSEANQGFYEKCGLKRKEVQMVKYFE